MKTVMGSSHQSCIWCGKPFSTEPESDNRRSEEHVVPECLGGTLVTTDVCVGCNNKLGSQVDHLIRHAQPIYEAGRKAGFSDAVLLPYTYRASASTDHGTQVNLIIRDGKSSVIPTLKKSSESFIGSTNGDVCDDQRQGLILNIKKKILDAHGLPGEVAEKAARQLVEDALKTPQPGSVLSDSSIGQNIRIEEVSPTVLPLLSPCRATPAVFKILYETLALYAPPQVSSYCAGVKDELRKAVWGAPAGSDILKEDQLSAMSAQAAHEIGFEIESSTKLSVFVVFFGCLRYSVSWSVQGKSGSKVYFQDGRYTRSIPVQFR